MTSGDRQSIETRRRFLAGVLTAGCVATAPAGLAAATTSPPTDNDGLGTVWWVELVSTNDLQASEYYGSIMGWDVKRTALSDGSREPQSGEPAYTLFRASGTEVAGALKVDGNNLAKNKPVWIVYFKVENVEKTIDKALKLGGRLLMTPFDIPGVRIAVISDLDGNPVGLAAPKAG